MQGQGYEDVRSLSSTSLLYSTMMLEERLFLYGRGTTANGYAGPLGTPTVTVASVSSLLAPSGLPAPTATAWTTSASVFVVVAADAGDLLGTNGYSMHQGPATAALSCQVTAGDVVQVTITKDVPGALGYNLYCASVAGGPYVYSGRTSYNTGYITAQPQSGPTVAPGGGDQSASSNNFDGILTNLAASASYVTRLNASFSTTNPGTEYQTALASLYENYKADPDIIDMNGFDRLSLSNALLNNSGSNGYRVFIDNRRVWTT